MGHWKSDTFKEYISDQLSEFLVGMSKIMKKVFNFVNVEGGVYHDITKTMINILYSAPASEAQSAKVPNEQSPLHVQIPPAMDNNQGTAQ